MYMQEIPLNKAISYSPCYTNYFLCIVAGTGLFFAQLHHISAEVIWFYLKGLISPSIQSHDCRCHKKEKQKTAMDSKTTERGGLMSGVSHFETNYNLKQHYCKTLLGQLI
ncbi:hypothetical protein ILYODFUR_003614 [Ilyodon furcidens]|uniref:Uncharacterized protein n=1 Tax=Ilyodon furcidens TaxID=33524 RepID=A0ABV0V0V9_9TELE